MIKISLRSIPLFLTFIGSLVHAEQKGNLENPFMYIDEKIEQALEAFQVPGCAVGIVVDGKVVLTKGYGLRNLAKKLPVTEDTIFPIGSCTMPFTALALAQLAEEGILHWDDPVIRYIPEFRLQDSYATEHVTIRDLAANRSGMPRHDGVWFNSELSRYDIVSRLKFLEPSCSLREKFQFNNMMFSLIGHVIEKVTGKTWEEVVISRIMAPLGMTHSCFFIEESQKSNNFSLPYVEDHKGVHSIPFRNLANVGPVKSINSSAKDMAKWVQLLLSDGNIGEVHYIGKEALNELHSLQITASNITPDTISSLGSGLGWNLGMYKDQYIVHRNGLIDGFMSMTALLPEKKIGVVILSNNSSPGFCFVSSILYSIIDEFLGVERQNWIATEKVKYEQSKIPSKELEESTPLRNLNKYQGSYVHPGYGTVQIYVENSRLFALFNQMIIPLAHQGKEVFRGICQEEAYPYLKWDFTFVDNSNGDISELRVSFEPAVKPIEFQKQKLS